MSWKLINNICVDLKKKVELETNELRDKMQFDKKVGNSKMKEKKFRFLKYSLKTLKLRLKWCKNPYLKMCTNLSLSKVFFKCMHIRMYCMYSHLSLAYLLKKATSWIFLGINHYIFYNRVVLWNGSSFSKRLSIYINLNQTWKSKIQKEV